jgi:hypothetical protein
LKFHILIHGSLLALAVVGCANAANATELAVEVNAGAGQDSNPYRLSTNVTSGGFAELDGGMNVENKMSDELALFVSMDADTRQYAGDAGDASDWRSRIEGGIDLKRRLAGKNRMTLKLGARADAKRGTYVSRITGLIGTAGGVPIPDRFNFNRLALFEKFDYYINRDIQLSLDIEYRDKNYVEDYAALGIDRYDNAELIVQPQVEYEFNDAWQIQVSTEFRNRTYDDRRVVDALGVPVAGTDREYDYQKYGANLRWKLSDDKEFKFAYDFGTRRDNGVGYLDYDSNDFSIRYKQRFEPTGKLSIRVYHVQDDYVNAVAILNPDEQRSKSGNGIKLDFERDVFQSYVPGLAVVVGIDLFNGTNTIPQFAYDQNELLVGLTKHF